MSEYYLESAQYPELRKYDAMFSWKVKNNRHS